MKSNRENVKRLLKTARGQLDGLLKMVDDDRYCIDISNQLMATQAILRKVNRQVLHDHLDGCVREAFKTGDSAEKVEEIIKIVDKLS